MMIRFGFQYYVVVVFALFLAGTIYLFQSLKTLLISINFKLKVKVSLWQVKLSRAVLIALPLFMVCLQCMSSAGTELVSGVLYGHIN